MSTPRLGSMSRPGVYNEKKKPSLNTSFVNPFTYLTNISKQDARFFFSQSGADWGASTYNTYL